jgi:hypothetical protein
MSKQTFAEWFKAQHGERENGLLTECSDDRLRDAVRLGRQAEAELSARELWDEKQQSALYAWQARDAGR